MERLKIARKKAAELQLENLKRQQAEVRNQLQQQEIIRLRNQLTSGGGGGSAAASSSAASSPNVPPNMQRSAVNMINNHHPPQLQPTPHARIPRPGLPPGARPIATIPPQHSSVRPAGGGTPSHSSGSFQNQMHLMNGGDLPVVSQVFSMGAMNALKVYIYMYISSTS